MEQESLNSAERPKLDEASRQELRMLLLLDWMMSYDQLNAEKKKLGTILNKLEEQVSSLKKGFFKSVEKVNLLFL